MHLKTSLGSAYIHNIDLIDKSKEVILFVPGAGMDHRVADLLDLNSKVFNKVISIDLPGHGGSPLQMLQLLTNMLILFLFVLKS